MVATKTDVTFFIGYEVEDIVDHKIKGKKKYFKIRWKNYDESQDTWEPEQELACPEIIERYLEKHPEAAVKLTPAKPKKVCTHFFFQFFNYWLWRCYFV